ncbi:MAG TPA: YciI family protein [Gemmatimonadaceae bacterium]|jgi:hypothetical protein
MRYMLLIKANADSEAGVSPSMELLTQMAKYNEALVKAGVLLDGGGLQPSSAGTRVEFDGSRRIVTDGPFAETKELIAGFWMIQVKSKEEAIEWVKRCPNPMGPGYAQIEMRRMFETADFVNATPELLEQEESQKRRSAAQRA